MGYVYTHGRDETGRAAGARGGREAGSTCSPSVSALQQLPFIYFHMCLPYNTFLGLSSPFSTFLCLPEAHLLFTVTCFLLLCDFDFIPRQAKPFISLDKSLQTHFFDRAEYLLPY